MSQLLSHCHKFTTGKEFNKLYLLLTTASVSIFWTLATGGNVKAQEQPFTSNPVSTDSLVSLGQNVPVPTPPPPVGKRLRQKQVLPPPPQDNQANETGDQLKGTLNQVTSTNRQQQVSSATVPTFNQFLNTQANVLASSQGGFSGNGFSSNSQASNRQVAPLPVLPGAVPRREVASAATPSFEESTNGSTSESAVVNSNNAASTFNQLLSQNAALPSSATAAATFNQPPNNQSTQATTEPQTFNQFLASQQPPVTNQQPPVTNQQSTFISQQQEFSAPSAPPFNQLAPLPPLPGMGQDMNPGMNSGMNPSMSQTQIPSQIPQAGSLTAPAPVTQVPQQINNQQRPFINSTALREPELRFQGVYVTQGETSARARLSGILPLTPNVLFGATLDLTSQGSSFDNSRNEGLNINELYFATSMPNLPNLRFVVGQVDLTSYFDRNSFAKDGAAQFFNPVFQTNPALAATGIASRPSLLVNWSVTDNIEAKAAVFSSSDRIGDFALDGFAGEVGIRYGNAIIRGTYATDRDGGARDSFPESFQIARGNNQFGPIKTDREEAYGLNAEVFIPNLKLGLFGRYGRYENRDLGQGADTYVLGASLVDVFTQYDRLGLAYGRRLSSDRLRRSGEQPDVLELFYDFEFLPNLRLGFTVQGRDSFDETVVGVRVRTDLDITPRGRNAR
ncbi:MAG: porin [Scytonematopsis contorta HA4267-MV1]|jgi:hypothetical protein|nr:porin [Scytonematopsis contorta HA4267-MV1]